MLEVRGLHEKLMNPEALKKPSNENLAKQLESSRLVGIPNHSTRTGYHMPAFNNAYFLSYFTRSFSTS